MMDSWIHVNLVLSFTVVTINSTINYTIPVSPWQPCVRHPESKSKNRYPDLPESCLLVLLNRQSAGLVLLMSLFQAPNKMHSTKHLPILLYSKNKREPIIVSCGFGNLVAC